MRYIILIILLAFAANSNFAAEPDSSFDNGIKMPILTEMDERYRIVEYLRPQQWH